MRNGDPGWRIKVEELGHIVLGRISRGQRRQVEACFDELQDGGVVTRDMGNKIRLAPWRYQDKRHSEASHVKPGHEVSLTRIEVRRNVVRRRHGYGRNVVVHSTPLIKDHEKR